MKSKINLKEKKLDKINVKLASVEKKIAEKKAKKLAKKKSNQNQASVNN